MVDVAHALLHAGPGEAYWTDLLRK